MECWYVVGILGQDVTNTSAPVAGFDACVAVRLRIVSRLIHAYHAVPMSFPCRAVPLRV
jgi:hypothetical protein